MKEFIRKVLGLVGIKISPRFDDVLRIEMARAKASGVLDTFAKMKNDLGAINADLADLVNKSDTEIARIKAEFEKKIAYIEGNKQAALDEIQMNNAVSARLNEFIK